MSSKNFNFVPTNCPKCDKYLKWKGVDVICDNQDCTAQGILRTEHFLRTLGAEEITSVTLENVGIMSIHEAYKIDETDIMSLEGFGVRSAQVIVEQIQGTLKTTPDKLLAAFGIKGCGLETARTILKHHDIEDLMNGLVSVDQLVSINGIGDITAQNIADGVSEYKDTYDYLKSTGLQYKVSDNVLRGKIFTLTGNGPIKRDILKNMIESKGGYVKGISKNKTDFLVCDNINSQSGKSKKARQYGVPIITYEELIDIIEGLM
jgi:DNA ligase (NAD+)